MIGKQERPLQANKKAVALKYKDNEKAPRIIAKGTSNLAELIIKIARENNIHIEESSVLCNALMQFELGDYIPEEMYGIIAELLGFVYKLKMDQ